MQIAAPPDPLTAGLVVHTPLGTVEIPATAFDFAGFCRWSQSDAFPKIGRIDFLAGVIDIDLSLEAIKRHSAAGGLLYASVLHSIETRDIGEVFHDGMPVVVKADGLTYEPMICCVTTPAFDSRRVTLTVTEDRLGRYVELVGSPDLVVEIISGSSVTKDTAKLFDLYYAAGVQEYWLIDARGEAIDFRLLTRGETQWVDAAVDAEGFYFSPVLGRRYRLDRRSDRGGGWRYELQERETTPERA